jgi:hypothetical protein
LCEALDFFKVPLAAGWREEVLRVQMGSGVGRRVSILQPENNNSQNTDYYFMGSGTLISFGRDV